MFLTVVVASFDLIKSRTFFKLQTRWKKRTLVFYEHNPLANIICRGCEITNTLHDDVLFLAGHRKNNTWNRMPCTTKIQKTNCFPFWVIAAIKDGLRNFFYHILLNQVKQSNKILSISSFFVCSFSTFFEIVSEVELSHFIGGIKIK